MVRRALVLALAVVVLGPGCSGSGSDTAGPTTTTRPPSFDEQVCQVTESYAQALTDEVNRFQDESRDAAGPADRRRLYLDAWDRVEQVNDDFEAELADLDTSDEADGDTVVDALSTALAANREEEADGVEEANGLPDDAFDGITVPEGSLFTGTEKMRAKVRHALTDSAAAPC